jgi:multidrug resistance efflux pump
MIIPVIGLLILKGTEYLGLKLKEQDIARQTAELNRKIELERLKADVKAQQAYVQQLKDRVKQRKAEIEVEHKQTIQKINDMEAVKALSKSEAEEARRIADSSAEYAMKAADEEAQLTENQINLEQEKLDVMNQVLADREAENDQILTLQTS